MGRWKDWKGSCPDVPSTEDASGRCNSEQLELESRHSNGRASTLVESGRR